MTTRRAANLAILSVAALAMAPRIASAQTQLTIVLPPPRADFGKSLGEVLRLRRSTRSFDPRPLPPQVRRSCCGPHMALTGRPPRIAQHPRGGTRGRLTSTPPRRTVSGAMTR
jgi:hypothetical protein